MKGELQQKYFVRDNNYLFIIKSNPSKWNYQWSISFDELKNKYNFDNYYIIKISSRFRIIEYNELERWAGFALIEKSKYTLEELKYILNKMNKIPNIIYLNGIPPMYILNKVEEIKHA